MIVCMARSLQDQIDDNDAAIAKAEAAQSYTRRGFSSQRALLATLYKERERLEKKQAEANANSGSMASLMQINRAR